ncbi:MAG: DUF4845 domain-containing protein [Deltaproteobacteria bacterium]|nr:DUF4845 domain-containing protein [Deltaproteobacteria bacterium]
MKVYFNQKGISLIKISIYMLLVALFYFGYLYVPVVIRYYNIKEAVSGAANQALSDKRDDLIRTNFSKRLKKEYGINVHPTALVIIREPSRSRVSAKMQYQEHIRYVPFDYIHVINITAEHTAMGHYMAY